LALLSLRAAHLISMPSRDETRGRLDIRPTGERRTPAKRHWIRGIVDGPEDKNLLLMKPR